MTDIEKLKDCLLHNNPSLFVGAGFSLGARQQNGDFIPSGNILKERIIIDILKLQKNSAQYKEFIELPLSRVCTITVSEKGNEKLYEYLKSVFQNVCPEEFHKSYIRYPWYNIYSTNIDDIIENACQLERVPILVYSQKHRTQTRKDNVLTLYKLHGCVNNLEAGIIFEEEDYVNSIVERADHRFGNLSIDFQNRDFVFVGSDFNDFNIKYYLNLYATTPDSGRGNLFFINPSPSYAFKCDIKKVGGILIEYNAEKFAEFLQSISFDSEEIDNTKFLYDGYVCLRNIKDSTNFNETSQYDSDLYLGASPKWTDIFYDWDVLLSPAIDIFVSTIKDFENSDEKTLVYTILGKGYSGKSVLIKRLAHILANENYEVISYEGREFSSNRFLRYIENTHYDKYALIIDDASYQYAQFEYIYKHISSKIKLCIISTSRIFFHTKRKYSLVDINYKEYELSIPIDRNIANNIIEKLGGHGYLGRILPTYSDKISQITYAQKFSDIASSVFAITHGKDFQQRFAKDVSNILKMGPYRDALIKLVIFQKMQLPYCPRELFAKIYRNGTIGILTRLEDIIREQQSQRIELKNEFIGDFILKNITQQEIINSLKDLLISISSMVENTSNSYWNEVQSVLMRDKLVKKYLRIKPSYFKQMLYEIRAYYSENYNYWLQLGIAEQQTGAYDKALIHFTQAETYGPKSYMVKNAIGRNYMFQAMEELDNEEAIKLFKKSKNILFDLINNREEYQAKAYSTHTYIAGLIRFYKHRRSLKIQPNEVEEAKLIMNNVLKKYKNDPMFDELNNAFVKFILQYSSNNKFNLEELQEFYSDKSKDIEFTDFD